MITNMGTGCGVGLGEDERRMMRVHDVQYGKGGVGKQAGWRGTNEGESGARTEENLKGKRARRRQRPGRVGVAYTTVSVTPAGARVRAGAGALRSAPAPRREEKREAHGRGGCEWCGGYYSVPNCLLVRRCTMSAGAVNVVNCDPSAPRRGPCAAASRGAASRKTTTEVPASRRRIQTQMKQTKNHPPAARLLPEPREPVELHPVLAKLQVHGRGVLAVPHGEVVGEGDVGDVHHVLEERGVVVGKVAAHVHHHPPGLLEVLRGGGRGQGGAVRGWLEGVGGGVWRKRSGAGGGGAAVVGRWGVRAARGRGAARPGRPSSGGRRACLRRARKRGVSRV